ncbi:phosphoribosylformylglycinamidine synthase [Flavobacteriaceae bacterium]|nr:phosphoribosylformylglycinamidine synthase [Flavobacteriaceae bacterium]
MILFFGDTSVQVFALKCNQQLPHSEIQKLSWLFGEQPLLDTQTIAGEFYGPRATMVTPWSTNAVEITQNMGLSGIERIEVYKPKNHVENPDLMLVTVFDILNQELFDVDLLPEAIQQIEDIAAYNKQEGLALSDEEVIYLEKLANSLNRSLTDSEVFGFSQVNSEHCRHKIFNGQFIIDGEEKTASLFQLIKKTSKVHPNTIVSAYKDNVAFIDGPEIEQFAPQKGDEPSLYQKTTTKSVISLKAETHNFPTTVEPFNGAATGSGGEIRDRLAGGQGSIPLAGTAVYMTPYSRVQKERQNSNFPERKWLYQTPIDILIKASNGASDFGNKFGQPLIAGSVLTFEHKENNNKLGFDKVIMLAGGIGYGKKDQAQKSTPKKGDKIIILGGDNYRIGMGGAAVSSSDTGAFGSAIELNAVQRSNPEMQKRVANAIRALVEAPTNPIVSIHDHGAGGHLNCLSELVEDTGGTIQINALPLGDPTLSAKEIIGNESQERMGLILAPHDASLLEKIALRERAPFYVVGEVTEDHHFSFVSEINNEKPVDLALSALFGSAPKTVMDDQTIDVDFAQINYSQDQIKSYVEQVLQLEAVACKDWLTNKVDRCVTGRVAQQQCVGEIQLPLSNCGVIALDFTGTQGIATSIGHAPISALIDPAKGSVNSIAEALTNIVWAPLEDGLKSVSLSANWMWPCNNTGEDARLYNAVEACADFAIALGINIPTGKDSLSMKQKYPDGDVIAPGTVIISAAGQCSDIQNIVTPVAKENGGSLYYLDFSQDAFHLGGSSFAQNLNSIGTETPTVLDPSYFKTAFNTLQSLIKKGFIQAGHDIGSGGLITSLLEMCFPSSSIGMTLDFSCFKEDDLVKILFSEKSAVLLQSQEDLSSHFKQQGITVCKIGEFNTSDVLKINELELNINQMRMSWMATSKALEKHQTTLNLAEKRAENIVNQPLNFEFPKGFEGTLPPPKKGKIKAAVLREKGSNSEREMAYAMDLSGFEVRDVHMTDLIEGRETLEDIQFLVAVGGFSNSDVLGSAKGWAGAIKFNTRAKTALSNFFSRPDTLSLGVCNGCQLFVELGFLSPTDELKPKMLHNDSGKFECIFTAVKIEQSNSIMMKGLEGSTLGIWAAHGEGKFSFPNQETHYQIPAKYLYSDYPSNPNGSDYNAAMLSSNDGRHLVMMPHLERSTFSWNWAHYPSERTNEISPWILAFENAFDWLRTTPS